jgi:glycosyltransferase involved in cell wall biosynthesis
VTPNELADLYRVADYTINISDAEGFGLATLESLSCGTPIIVNMTGGLQEQVTDGKNWFGFGIEPSSKTVIGSLQVPYIYEDRMNQRDFEKTLTKAIKNPAKKYKQMSSQGKRHVFKNYNFENFEKSWVELMDNIIKECGSWETRKGYKRWHLLEAS